MRYSEETMRHACSAIALIAGRPQGIDASTIRVLCGFSPKVCETTLVALIHCGAVTREEVIPPAARGARRRFVYFLAPQGRWDGGGDSSEDGAANDCRLEAEEKEEEEEDGGGDRNGGGGGSWNDEADLCSYTFDAGGGVFAVETGEIIAPETGGIIPDKTGEIIDAPFVNINNNTQEIAINKRARKKRAFRNKSIDSGRLDALVASADLRSPEARAIRQTLKEIAWDSQANVGLFDRAVALVVTGAVRACEMINAAREAVAEAKRMGERNWRRFTLRVKGFFDNVLFLRWTPTSQEKEPAPGFGRFVAFRLNDDEEELEPRVSRVNGRNVLVV